MKNKQIAKRYFEEIWNKKDASIAQEIIADSLETRFIKSHGYGYKGLINVINARYKVFPDLLFSILDMVEEGTKIWIFYNFTGTHKGDFWGIKPTNKKVDFNGILMLEIKEGKVIKGSSLRDELRLLEQIGFVKIPNRDDRQ